MIQYDLHKLTWREHLRNTLLYRKFCIVFYFEPQNSFAHISCQAYSGTFPNRSEANLSPDMRTPLSIPVIFFLLERQQASGRSPHDRTWSLEGGKKLPSSELLLSFSSFVSSKQLCGIIWAPKKRLLISLHRHTDMTLFFQFREEKMWLSHSMPHIVAWIISENMNRLTKNQFYNRDIIIVQRANKKYRVWKVLLQRLIQSWSRFAGEFFPKYSYHIQPFHSSIFFKWF